MKIWHFSEQPYYPAFDVPGEMRINLPQRHCDPVEAGRLLNRYLDEWCLADELGFNIMVNEHHAAATCMSTSCLMTLNVLARLTSNARLLALGVPLGNRSSPLRVAEEVATVDCLSGGRLELGLVKGAAFELHMSNRNPHRFMDRFWDAHDLLIAAFTNQDEVFSWDSEYFHYRTVSLWPRPIQQPHPPIWMTATSGSSSAGIAKLGYKCATFLSGAVAGQTFAAYRSAYKESFGVEPPDDHLGYLGLVAIASTREEAMRRANAMRGFFDTGARVDAHYRNPPGFLSVADNVRMIKAGPNAVRPRTRDGKPLPTNPTIEQYMDAGLMFVGTPDDVFEQLAQFYQEVGGFGNLLNMGQAGNLGHEETVDSMKLLAHEVMPRLQTLSIDDTPIRYEGFG